LTGVNLGDIKASEKIVGDFRHAVETDPGLTIRTAIELGHIFKLNLRYSKPMKAHVLDQTGKEIPMVMGCYGIGVNRILAAAIEQYADDKGIVWPRAIAPYQVEIIQIASDDPQTLEISAALERELETKGIDVLVDDRPDSAGIKFNDADLIGIPLRVILGPKNLKAGKAEIKVRKTLETRLVDLPDLAQETLKALDSLK
jgi:prolyl-tRNA synthetase